MPGENEFDGPAVQPAVQRLGVVGVGLIGGSVAMAAKKRLGCRVVGVGRSAAKLAPAVEAGVLDEAAGDAAALSGCDLVVVCTPVDRLAADVKAAARHAPDAAITDAGSTKASIAAACAGLPTFVGAHPMAGSEKTGWRHASADLFEGRVTALTPREGSPVADRVEAFWRSLGSRTVRMDAAEHDRAVARVSHAPHFAAAALVAAAADTRLAAGGFRDTTRVAAGDPALWTAIARENAGPLAEALGDLSGRLLAMKAAVEAERWDAVEAMLAKAAERRRSLDP